LLDLSQGKHVFLIEKHQDGGLEDCGRDGVVFVFFEQRFQFDGAVLGEPVQLAFLVTAVVKAFESEDKAFQWRGQ
jgi:hypothetical protein